MRKNTVYKIHRFRPWNRTWKVQIVAKKTITAITVKEETAAIMMTVVIVGKKTLVVVGIAA